MRTARRKRWYRTGRMRMGRQVNSGAYRRNPARNKNIKISGVNLAAIIAIIGIAVLCGFLTTKFVVYPLLLGEEADFDVSFDFGNLLHADEERGADSGVSDNNNNVDTVNTQDNKEKSDVNESPDVNPVTSQKPEQVEESTGLTSGYCIQYGCFSSESAAANLIEELKASGLTARMVKQDDKYKVVGQIFSTKEEAAEAQKAVLEYGDPEYRDVFITNV